MWLLMTSAEWTSVMLSVQVDQLIGWADFWHFDIIGIGQKPALTRPQRRKCTFFLIFQMFFLVYIYLLNKHWSSSLFFIFIRCKIIRPTIMIMSLASHQHRPLQNPSQPTANYQKAAAYFETTCNEENFIFFAQSKHKRHHSRLSSKHHECTRVTLLQHRKMLREQKLLTNNQW